jgi:hypothetical protein
MRRLLVALVIFASAVLLVYCCFAALTVAGKGFNPPRPIHTLRMLGFGISGFGLQFLSAWLTRPRPNAAQPAVQTNARGHLPDLWGHFWFRLFVSFCCTLPIAVLVFWLMLALSGV